MTTLQRLAEKVQRMERNVKAIATILKSRRIGEPYSSDDLRAFLDLADSIGDDHEYIMNSLGLLEHADAADALEFRADAVLRRMRDMLG